MSFRTVFITFSVLAILVLLGGGAFLWLELKGSRGLDIDLLVPKEIAVGEPFDLEVDVGNGSDNVLEDAELLVELPEDIVFLGSSPEKRLDSKVLGNLGVGSLNQETFRLIALGGENTVKEIIVTVTYLPSSLGSKFEKSQAITFSVLEPVISLDLSLPQKVFAGEDFEIKVTYKNVSELDFSDLKLKMSYPPVFVFKSATLKPDLGNNTWNLGGLRSGSEGEFEVKGQLIGPDESFFELAISLEAGFLGRAYTILKRTAAISIAPSPLSLAINLNDNPDYVAHLGDELVYKLAFLNNTEVGLKDVIIKARLIGEMFDLRTLSTRAALRAIDNTLIWNTANTPELALLSPGSSGAVEFRLKVMENYPIQRLSDKNYVLKIEAEIESPTVPEAVAAEKTLGIAKHEAKVGGRVIVEALGFFRDAPSGILNRGPWPLKVGQATNFTVHWRLINASTDLRDVEVKAFLGGNVRATGVIKSTIPPQPVYNERTGELVWQIGNLQATRGVLTLPPEAIFQIEATPSINQLGSPMLLIQETSVSALDEFTGESLNHRDGPIASDSLNDPTVTIIEGRVVQ